MHRTVVVVDDERSIADMVASILRGEGLNPYIAYSGEEALSLLNIVTPDLLISDVMMPGINGGQLAIEFKKRYPECEVLLCSGGGRADAVEEFRTQGYDFKFLGKPFDGNDLLRSIGLCRQSTA